MQPKVSEVHVQDNTHWLERKASSSSYKSTLEKFEALIPSFDSLEKPSRKNDKEPGGAAACGEATSDSLATVTIRREGVGITLTGYEISEEECVAIFNQLDARKHGVRR